MKTHHISITLALAAGLLPFLSHAEDADIPVKGSIPLAKETAETAYAALAKVPIAEAVRIGAEKQPGTVTKAELVEDDGFLVWEVDVVGAKEAAHEVVIDAGNGKVLAVEVDHADNDEESANAKADLD
jgi:uncharacterized membrane protein YkoI